MKTFGDLSQFAVQILIDKKVDDFWLYGHVRFVINHHFLGDWDNSATLNTFVVDLENILSRRGKCVREILWGVTSQVFYEQAKIALWIDHGQSDKQLLEDHKVYGSLHVTPGCDSFDNYRMYLMENHQSIKLIWSKDRGENSGSIYEHIVNAEDFYRPIAFAIDWLNKQFE